METSLYNLVRDFQTKRLVLRALLALVLLGLVGRHYGAGPTVHNFPPLPDTTYKVLPRRKPFRRRRQLAEASASYSRFSSGLQDENSIDRQQESCRERAARDGNTISPELEFADHAVSGTKRNREGLNAMLAAAKAGKFNTLYIFSLSRLARETAIAIPLLKQLVYGLGIRVISVSEGADSSSPGWDMLASVLSAQHEQAIKELRANVLSGQRANVKNGYSVGDYCFGYSSLPVAGTENSRRGRHAKPRMQYVLDPETSSWVVKIFHWFVNERRSLSWITRELNKLNAPKDHRSTTKDWHHQYVTGLLANRKYIGYWPWGEMTNVRDPLTGDVTQEPRPAEEVEQNLRHFPELQLIDDEIFAAAQELLAKNAARCAHQHRDDGTFSHDQHDVAATSPPHLLSCLIKCGHCGRTFYVGGPYGKYLFCHGYKKGRCPCQTTLNRKLAEKLILEQISQRILRSPEWSQLILDLTKAAWVRRQRSLPNELRDVERALAEIDRRIERLVDSFENEAKPDPSVQQRLAERRAQRRELEDRLSILRNKADHALPEPTIEWVQQKLQSLHEVLESPTPAAALALQDLVGGQIVVHEIREDGRKRYFLRGSFQIGRAQVLTALDIRVDQDALADGDPEIVTIDFVRDNPLDVKAEEAKSLWDQELSNKAIAEKLGCSRAQVTKLLQHRSKVHDEELPNGYARRAQRMREQPDSAIYKRISDDVMRLFDQGVLLQEISERLGHDRDTITKAVKYWHESQGLPVPDGRTRRRTLQRTSQENRDENSEGSETTPA